MTSGYRNPSIAVLIASIVVMTASFACVVAGQSQHTSMDDPSKARAETTADIRPDPSIASSDMYVLQGNQNISSATFGIVVSIHAIVYNLGYSNATNVSVELGIRSTSTMVPPYNSTLFEGLYNISSSAPDNFVDVNGLWRISIVSRSYPYEIWALIDPEGSLDEKNESNNFATRPFTIDWLSMEMVITPDHVECHAGEALNFTAVITYYGTLTPVSNLPGLEFFLIDLRTNEEVQNTRTTYMTTNEEGVVVGMISLPSDLSSGRYQVLAEFYYSENVYSGNTPIAVEVIGQSSSLDPILIAGIVIAMIVVIAIVAAYLVMRKPKV